MNPIVLSTFSLSCQCQFTWPFHTWDCLNLQTPSQYQSIWKKISNPTDCHLALSHLVQWWRILLLYKANRVIWSYLINFHKFNRSSSHKYSIIAFPLYCWVVWLEQFAISALFNSSHDLFINTGRFFLFINFMDFFFC